MKRTWINGRWPLMLPDHRADRPEWPYWEATRLAAMRAHIQPGDVVYDIGAEAGDFPALFASWGARVVLIEPNPKAWATIRETFEANGLYPEACVEALISDTTTNSARSMHRWPDSAKGEMVPDHGFHHIGQHDDPTCTLDELVWHHQLPQPDVVTMDVEGGEGHVIRGARAVLREIRPAVFMSIHPQFMADLYGEHPRQIHDEMAAFGYQARFLGEDHELHYVWTHPTRRMFPGVAEDYYIHENNPRKVF